MNGIQKLKVMHRLLPDMFHEYCLAVSAQCNVLPQVQEVTEDETATLWGVLPMPDASVEWRKEREVLGDQCFVQKEDPFVELVISNVDLNDFGVPEGDQPVAAMKSYCARDGGGVFPCLIISSPLDLSTTIPLQVMPEGNFAPSCPTSRCPSSCVYRLPSCCLSSCSIAFV